MNILEQIHSPAELKYLSETQLEIVATQIRELIIKTVAQNGGHLAPCLGTVELTLALHKVFLVHEINLFGTLVIRHMHIKF